MTITPKSSGSKKGLRSSCILSVTLAILLCASTSSCGRKNQVENKNITNRNQAVTLTPRLQARQAGILAARESGGRPIAILCSATDADAWYLSREFARAAKTVTPDCQLYSIRVDPESQPVEEAATDLFAAGVSILYLAIHSDPSGDPFSAALQAAKRAPDFTRYALLPFTPGFDHPNGKGLQ